MSRTLAERFWAKVEKKGSDECWTWIGRRDQAGYGKFYVKDGTRETTAYAHRISYELSIGPIPNGLCVLHHCDNPPCVNPNCFFLGTQADNMADMDRKGRRGYTGSKGENNHNAKLTENDVREIRAAQGGETGVSLARRYRVTSALISLVQSRKAWRHVV